MSQPIELAKVQGLVLSGYGHTAYGAYLFFTFNDAERGRAWLKDISLKLATAAPWPAGPDGKAIKPERVLTLGLSYPGLAALGLPQEALDSFPEDFRDGPASERRAKILGDTGSNAPEHWVVGGSNADQVHGLLIILAVSEDQREALIAEYTTEFADHAMTLVWTDRASKLPGNKEHFGFLDGVSQPRFEFTSRKSTVSEPTIAVGEFLMGYRNEYGQQPLSPKLGDYDLGRNGTYMVYRRLYQDVAAFWNYIALNVVVKDVGEGHPEAERMSHAGQKLWLASKFVGRWPSGVPLTLSPEKDDPHFDQTQINTFLFHERDPKGLACPIGSHVRRCNPRDSQPPDPKESLVQSNRHLLVRRGMPYGAPLFPLENLPPTDIVQDDEQDRGLIFVAMNASISRQFEFVQQMWVNNTKFHGLYSDKDPIVGNSEGDYAMTIEREPVRRRVNNLPRFVTVKGSGYFFVPSIGAVRRIAEIV
jgi:Dyp-type peroxidase family